MTTTWNQKVIPTTWAIIRLLRWHKPTGRLILMVPALWGVFLAGQGTPPWSLVLVMILGTVATSGAGCVVNDLWDRDLDPLVERTRTRPLASRELSLIVGVVLLLVGLICALILTTFLNPTTFYLCVATVPVILLYPGAKRVFPIPQLVLALAWGFAVLISWTAVTGQDPTRPIWEPATWFLWAATILWTLGFDTVYALSDREDDERAGIHSSARFFGRLTPTAVGLFFLGTAIFLLCTGLSLGLHFTYYVTLILAVAGWIWQTWRLHDVNHPRSLYPFIFQCNVAQGFVLLVGMISGCLLN
jgi:4-hydroxybenzoate polyprenyltransferase